MFGKTALATVMLAAVPMMGADIAEAAGRDGNGKGKGKIERGVKAAAKAKTNRNKKTIVVYRPNSNTVVIRTANYVKTYFGGGKKRKGFKCVAAAKTRAGYGRRIPGIRGKKFGHKACQRAMRECRRELRHRKASGRNPFARCVVVKRG